MAKQTTIKVLAKDYKAFQLLAPTEGIKIVQADQLGDTVIAHVKFRDQGYLYYLGYNVCKAMLQGTNSLAPNVAGQTPPSPKVTEGKKATDKKTK